MAVIIDFENKTDKAIELPDGTIFDVPERTAELYENIVGIEKNRPNISEFDYFKKILEALYGREEFKKIAPKGKKTNLDYLAKVVTVSLELFLQEKIEAEALEMEKKIETLAPFTDKLQAISPVIDKVK